MSKIFTQKSNRNIWITEFGLYMSSVI